MPDLEFERIELNAIPDGDMPVFHASQYETMRPFIADLKWGEAEFAPGEGCWCTLSIRKPDDTLVIIDNIAIDNNEVSCILTQQAVACVGDSFSQLKVWAESEGEAGCIACLNFILHVQPDPEAGGLTSESEINNLTQQIEVIAQEVIGEDYYNKTEVDSLLDLKADKATTYTKTQVDSALALKANSADLATVATTGDYDDLLNKPTIPDAQIQSDWEQADNTKVDYIKNKPDISAMIADALLAVMPVGTESGPIASFNTELAVPLVDCTSTIVATQAPGTPTPSDPKAITGYTGLNLTRCGVNLFVETWEEGYINSGTGAIIWSTAYKTTDFIKVSPNAQYYCKATIINADTPNVCYYNANKEKIVFQSSVSSFFNNVFTTPNSADICYMRITLTIANTSTDNFTINYPSTDTTYHAYNGTTYAVDWTDEAGTVYGGTLDLTTGVLTVTHGEIDSYNGESINEPWLSSKDVYTEGGTPTTGAQVVYPLTTPVTYNLTPTQVRAIVGANNVYSDTNGDTTVQYKDSIQHYIDTRI